MTNSKGKTFPLQAWTGPEGSRRLKLPNFKTWHMKVVRLSALRTSRLYPPGNTPGSRFCKRLSQPQCHRTAGRIMSMKNSNDTIGNRTVICEIKCVIIPVVRTWFWLPFCQSESENIWKHGLVPMVVCWIESQTIRLGASWSSQKASFQHQGRRGY